MRLETIESRRRDERNALPALPDDVHQLVADFFQRIPFNRMLGIRVASLSRERVVLDLPMKDELIGNFVQGILHGGVISSLLDVTGGAMALIGALERHRELPGHERMARLSKLGTIDLRVDYLSPDAAGRSPPMRCRFARATRSQWCARNCIATTARWSPSVPVPICAADSRVDRLPAAGG